MSSALLEKRVLRPRPWFEEVRRDHEAVKQQAQVMDSTLGMDLSAADKRVVLSWTLRNIWPELELHLRKEEEALFTGLIRLLGKEATALVMLRREHEELRSGFRHLAELLQDPERLEWDRITLAVEGFLYLLEEHEKVEERLLLDVLKYSLNRGDLNRLVKEYHAVAEQAHSTEGWPAAWWNRGRVLLVLLLIFCLPPLGHAKEIPREKAALTFAPEVPPPVTRKKPIILEVRLDSSVKTAEIAPGAQYPFWTFNGRVPGPFIRARVGDVLEVHHTSSDASGMPHNVDFHAVTGPGGGAKVLTAVEGEEKVAWFKLMHPGLYIYHCAAPPVMDHIANGMYGLILVEPEKGLPRVDREFYVLQSEFYAKEPAEGQALLEFSHEHGLREDPRFVVFNGRVGSLTNGDKLKAKTGERVRIFFGNAGPNLISSFHVIGEIFDSVYREGDLVSPPGRSVQTTLVPAGGATVVEFQMEVPGDYTLVDHAIFRVEKGAVGFLEAEGKPRHDLYVSKDEAEPCEGCLVHP